MQVRCLPATSATPLGDWSGDTLVLGLLAGDDGQPLLGALEALLGAGLRQRLEQRAFKAKPRDPPSNPAPTMVTVPKYGFTDPPEPP